jgi:hypothetical protein
MTRRRASFAALACLACCVGPLALLVAGGSVAGLAWLLWPAVGIAVALVTVLAAGSVRQRRVE